MLKDFRDEETGRNSSRMMREESVRLRHLWRFCARGLVGHRGMKQGLLSSGLVGPGIEPMVQVMPWIWAIFSILNRAMFTRHGDRQRAGGLLRMTGVG